jgi:iron(III) transport system substrate-binding protein
MTRSSCPSRRGVLFGASALALRLAANASLAHLNAKAAEMAPTEEALYERAKKEGALTWYTSHSDDATAQALGRRFEQLYPGVKVGVVRTTAQVAFQRVSQEIKAGAMEVDVLSSTDIGHFVYLKGKNQLEKFVPENAAKVMDAYKGYDPDGFYHVTSAGLIGLAYNTAKVRPSETPSNWTDLIDPKWKGLIGLGHPAFSGYVGTWTVTLRKLYGWQFFEALAKNNPRVGRSIVDTVTLLNSGESFIAGTAPHNVMTDSMRKGNPVAMVYPTDGSVLIIAPSGIMKGAKHPFAARLFMEYLLSVDASKIWAEHFNESVRPEVPQVEGVKSAKDVKTIRPTVEEITEGIPEVIKQWRDTFGV